MQIWKPTGIGTRTSKNTPNAKLAQNMKSYKRTNPGMWMRISLQSCAKLKDTIMIKAIQEQEWREGNTTHEKLNVGWKCPPYMDENGTKRSKLEIRGLEHVHPHPPNGQTYWTKHGRRFFLRSLQIDCVVLPLWPKTAETRWGIRSKTTNEKLINLRRQQSISLLLGEKTFKKCFADFGWPKCFQRFVSFQRFTWACQSITADFPWFATEA